MMKFKSSESEISLSIRLPKRLMRYLGLLGTAAKALEPDKLKQLKPEIIRMGLGLALVVTYLMSLCYLILKSGT